MDGRASPEFIGRDAECALLSAALRADHPAAVIGEAGIGKTTLVRAAAALTGRRLFEGAGFATLASTPFLALRRAIRSEVAGDPMLVASQVERVVGPGLLFVDDLQWVDRETRTALAQVAGRIAVVVASRDPADPSGDLAVVPWERVEVRELDAWAATLIARHVQPDLTPARLAQIVERAAGNPLVIEELARDGRESPTVLRAIAARVAGLSSRSRDMLWLLVIADRPLPTERLPSSPGELESLGLVTLRAGEIAMRHAMLRAAIAPLIPAAVVPSLHRRVAHLLDDDAEAARHLLTAGDHDEARELALRGLAGAVGSRRAALLEVVAAASTGNLATASRLDAARACRDLGDDEAVVRLLQPPFSGDDDAWAWRTALLADSLRAIGQADAAEELLAQAESHILPRTLGGLEVVRSRAIGLVYRGQPGAALDLLDRALAGVDPSVVACQMRSVRAAIALFAGRPVDIADLRNAWEEARRLGDEGPAGSMAKYLHVGLLLECGFADALKFARAEAARLEAAGVPARAMALLTETVQSLVLAGDLGAAIDLGDRLLERPAAAEVRVRATIYLAHALVLAGRLKEANLVRSRLAAPLPLAVQEADRLDEEAEAAYWGGRPRASIAFSTQASRLPRETAVNLVLPALVRSWAQLDIAMAQDPLPDFPPVACLAGAKFEAEGIHALAAGAPSIAVAKFEEAARSWAPFMAPRELVCRWAAGEAARRDRRLDACDRLQETLVRVDAMGFEPLAARVRRSLRLAGIRASRTSGRRAEVSELTEREREIVELVAGGLSNAEIARRMGLGRPSVAQALSRAMVRLGVDSRAQAVAALRRTV